jgi:autotransporter-associated beta strand protein
LTFGGAVANLRWDSQGDINWNQGTTTNWQNLGTSAPDVFFDFDSVLFNDTPGLQPTADIGDGITVRPSQITVDSTNTAYFIGGLGRIAGAAGVTKLGPSTLNLGGANNTYSGGVTVNGGMVRLTTVTGAGSGAVTVNSNTVLVAGGAHTNAINLAGGVVGSVTGVGSLAGNVTAAASTLSTIALTDPQDYTPNSEMNFTGNLLGSGNINVVSGSANLGVDGGVGFRLRGTGTSTFSGTITISNNVKGELQTGVTTPFSPAGTGKIRLVGGDATLGGAVTAATAANGYSELNIRNNSTNHAYLGNDLEMIGTGLATLNPLGSAPTNALSTMGNLKIGGGQELGVIRNSGQPQIVAFQSVTLTGGEPVFSPKTPGFGAAGASGSDLQLSNITQLATSGIIINGLRTLYLTGTNGYTGNTTISNGMLSLIGSSSLSNSPTISVAAPGTLSVTGRTGGTLSLVNGQTLKGDGSVTGNLVVGAGSTISPGFSVGTLTLGGFVQFQGTTIMEIDKAGNTRDLIQGAVNLTYGGTLVVSNLNNPLANGDSFKLFDAGGYSGSFAITPSAPGPGLAWDTSALTTSGTLKVAAAPAGPLIQSITVSAGNIIVSGSNGTQGNDYFVLASTNIALPLSNWTILQTNQFGAGGGFSFTNAISVPRRFYLLQLP